MSRNWNLDDLPPRMRRQALQQMARAPLERPIHVWLNANVRSLNEFSGRHSRIRSRERARIAAMLADELGHAIYQPPDYRQLITITRVLGKGQREFDVDNLAGGTLKHLIDALTTIGMWRDDSPRWLARRYLQDASRRFEGPGVQIRIEAIRRERAA